MTPAQYAAAVLRGIGAPANNKTVGMLIGWSKAEGPPGGDAWFRNNPLNTTESLGASRTVNSAGVKAYPNAAAGVAATVKTLTNGRYGGIIDAFRRQDPHGLGSAIQASPWGTGSLAAQTIAQTVGSDFGVANLPAVSAPPKPTVTAPSSVSTTLTGGGTDWKAAGAAVLHQGAMAPINVSGKFTPHSLLKNLVSAAGSGKFVTPTVATSTPETPPTGMKYQAQSVAGAGAPGAASKLASMAAAASGGPYSMAQHASAFNQSAAGLRANGTDCSGFVSWLLGPQGLGIWKQPLATPSIPTAPGIQAGEGKSITLYNDPRPGASGHVWIKLGGAYYESAGGGTGIHRMSAGQVQQYIATGRYRAYHPQGY